MLSVGNTGLGDFQAVDGQIRWLRLERSPERMLVPHRIAVDR